MLFSRTRAAIGALFFASTAAMGCAPTSEAGTPPEGLAAAVDDALLAYPSAGIGLARIENGAVAWTYYAGEQGPGLPVTPQTLFNTGSITKTITAELVLRLADAGHISLDEPIANAYAHPDLADDPRYIELTPRVLLSHRSGLLNWAYQYENFELAFVQDPPSTYAYSGEGYEMLAEFVAARMDEDFPSLADMHVFEPLGLDSMELGAEAAAGPYRAQPMNSDGEYGEPDRFAFPPSAADNLFTTLDDYAAFLVAVMADERRRDDPANARRTILTSTQELAPCLIEPAQLCPEAAGYGLGWEVFAYEGTHLLHHGGADWGERAFASFETANQEGYVVLVNGGNGLGVILDVLTYLDPDDPAARYMLALPVVQEALAQARVAP